MEKNQKITLKIIQLKDFHIEIQLYKKYLFDFLKKI